MVVSEVVGGVRDPEGGDGDVCLQHGPDLDRADGQVILKQIVGLDAVFDEIVVAHDVVSHVVLHC